MNIIQTIAKELDARPTQVDAAVKLLEQGDTVPFIARYRKEATGGLSDIQLRDLSERLTYLNELVERQQTVLKSIEEQGKLTPELQNLILSADTKTRLEDLYLPYKPKRRTKAQIAKEAGLEPLALELLKDFALDPNALAEKYINPEQNIADVASALEGARQILMEQFSENADLVQALRSYFWSYAVINSKVVEDKKEQGEKFADYFAFSENIKKIPSHRLLAILRGRKDGVLQLNIDFIEEKHTEHCYELMAEHYNINSKKALSTWLWQTVVWAYKVKLHSKLEVDLMLELKERSDEDAIKVFRDNLQNLLMAAPAGDHVVLGLDPGFRTGVKVVVIDGTGKLLTHVTIYPHPPQKQWDQSLAILAALCDKHQVKLVSIGNGTASRETDLLVSDLMKKYEKLKLTKIVVSEAGASVYSASKLASNEFPDLDVSIRGAVSIARRLQDPLAELVKIEPKSIGVGQYQHDVNQTKLERSLTAAVEDCVNAVGADVNTASVPLLSSISGLSSTVASNIVQFREQHGRFKNRAELKSVPRVGDKVFEQAAGFLRIMDGENPLDSSAVHPESYAIVERIAESVKKPVAELIANESLLNTLDPMKYVSDAVGLPTLHDIIAELKKPGRDPRPEFKMAKFAEGVNEIKDLKPGMKLEGVITNVANFGAFVDIGVHQDGLVHVSEIANHYVDDVHKVLKVGQIVTVWVVNVDEPRKRISLTMKQAQKDTAIDKPAPKIKKKIEATAPSAFAEQLKNAMQKK